MTAICGYVPGLAGIPATESSISSIDGEKGILFYRGYPIEQLAEHSNFEEVSLLLLTGELPTSEELAKFNTRLVGHRRIKYNIERILQRLPPSAHPMQVLQMGISSLSSFFPGTVVFDEGDYTEEQQYESAVTILSHVGTLVAMWEQTRLGYRAISPLYDSSYSENFLYTVLGHEPDPLLARIFDVCLVLHAEHTINASTFTAMVAASTLANPCSVIASATASLSGPLHGGANRAVINMLKEIGTVGNVEKFIEGRIKNKQVIWGMGHREYKTKDPRAKILQKLTQDLIEQRGSQSKRLEIAMKVEEVCEKHLAEKGVYPNVDFYSGILYREIGLRPELFTPIFAIARTAGWLAHYLEQVKHNRIFRPTQIYVGSKPRNYIPIGKRG